MSAATANTTDADVSLYKGMLHSAPVRRPTKTAASIRANLWNQSENRFKV